jgi:dual specificity MAP kinase phosphatase
MDIGKFQQFLEKKVRHRGDRHVEFEWNQIDEHIYVGTNSCCQMHFDTYLLKKGVTGDVSMEGERVDQPRGVAVFLWLPTKDHEAPTIDALMIGVKAIDEMISQGHKVYIHCKNGHGRGPTMAAAYYMYKEGMTADEAVAFVEERRDEAHIEKVQLEQLKKFEERLKEHE